VAKEIVFFVNDKKLGGVSTFLKSFQDNYSLISLEDSVYKHWFFKIAYAIVQGYRIRPNTIVMNEDLPSLLIPFFRKSRRIVFIHKNPDYLEVSLFWREYYRIVARYCDIDWYGVSKGQASELSRILGVKVQNRYTLYKVNYLPLKYSDKQINVLYWGRIVKGKGIEELFNLVEEISCLVDKNIVLNLVGPGEKSVFLNKILATCSIEVVCHGSRDLEYLANLDSLCAISLSNSEGFGLSNYELMGAGIPCLIKDVNYGPNELLKDYLEDSELGSFLLGKNYSTKHVVDFLNILFRNKSNYEKARQVTRNQWAKFEADAIKNNREQSSIL
jgi:glycosyltransferase involved in cell wall biosynthesis